MKIPEVKRFEIGKVYERPSRSKKDEMVSYKVLKRNDQTRYVTFVRLNKDGREVGPKISRKATVGWGFYEFCTLDKKNKIVITSSRRL